MVLKRYTTTSEEATQYRRQPQTSAPKKITKRLLQLRSTWDLFWQWHGSGSSGYDGCCDTQGIAPMLIMIFYDPLIGDTGKKKKLWEQESEMNERHKVMNFKDVFVWVLSAWHGTLGELIRSEPEAIVNSFVCSIHNGKIL